ncbi:MAG: RDD family protein [Blastocatellales bacterium]
MDNTIHQHSRTGRAMQMPAFSPGSIPDNQKKQDSCARCGRTLEQGLRFCTYCGWQLPPTYGQSIYLEKTKAARFRRFVAEILDRILIFFSALVFALPVILVKPKFYLWSVVIIVFVWNLLRDRLSNHSSYGKKFVGLRVARSNGQQNCGWWRMVGRRFVPACSQAAYSLLMFALLTGGPLMPPPLSLPYAEFVKSGQPQLALLMLSGVYDLVSMTTVMISAGAMRIEDYIFGTRVISVLAGKETHRKCATCKMPIQKLSRFCGHCGMKNTPIAN